MARSIYMIVPGGCHSTGGMCRMAAYCAVEWQAAGRQPAVKVLDSMGPYVKWREPFHFAVCIAHILAGAVRGRIALLHIHVAAYGSVVRKGLLILLGRALRIPVVIHMHGGDFPRFYDGLPGFVRGMISRVLRMADHGIVLAESWRRYYTTIVGMEPANLTVIKHGVPAPAGGPGHDAGQLVFLGLMSRAKGLEDLLAALARPPLAALAWHLTVAGHGDPAPFLSQARELGLDSRVTFLGWVDATRVGTLLSRAQLLLLPSHFEAMGLVLLEAMSYGVPIIATRVGGIPEVVADGRTGILVEPGDVSALSTAICDLLTDHDLCARLGQAGRQRFLSEFEIGAANARLQSVFASLIDPAGSARTF